MTVVPTWAEATVKTVLTTDERIEFVGTGRLDIVPPSGLMAMFYWITFIATNYLAILITALFRNRAIIVITQRRVLIVSSREWQFPFWVIPFSSRVVVDTIERTKVCSLGVVKSKYLWAFSAKGINVECESGSTRIINGLNNETYEHAQRMLS
ncbi:MAG: hypothetical protein J5I53_04420 [Bradyrhizobiaceae bacterium]|nr:hypothetical protein [Bradyrhizobiaceae bacterium]